MTLPYAWRVKKQRQRAFPGVTLLDDFNRADAATLGANWTADPGGYGLSAPSVSSNAATYSVIDPNWTAEAFWNVAAFGANIDLALVVKELPSDGTRGIYGFYDRLSDPGNATTQGYIHSFWWDRTEPTAIQCVCFRLPDFDLSETETAAIAGLSVGDTLAVRLRGGTFTYYHFHGGTWAVLTHIIDPDPYEAAGHVGIGIGSNGSIPGVAIDSMSVA